MSPAIVARGDLAEKCLSVRESWTVGRAAGAVHDRNAEAQQRMVCGLTVTSSGIVRIRIAGGGLGSSLVPFAAQQRRAAMEEKTTARWDRPALFQPVKRTPDKPRFLQKTP